MINLYVQVYACSQFRVLYFSQFLVQIEVMPEQALAACWQLVHMEIKYICQAISYQRIYIFYSSFHLVALAGQNFNKSVPLLYDNSRFHPDNRQEKLKETKFLISWRP